MAVCGTIEPGYHDPRHAVTRPDQGIFVTRYFLQRWWPVLGPEAGALVLALRLHADRTGRTFVSIPTIASQTGQGTRSVKRWLSDTPEAVKPCSAVRLAQWKALHEFFLLGKQSRYLPAGSGLVRRTSNVLVVAMDDPVHPDDRGQVGTDGAENVDNSAHRGQNGPYAICSANLAPRIVSDRSNAKRVNYDTGPDRHLLEPEALDPGDLQTPGRVTAEDSEVARIGCMLDERAGIDRMGPHPSAAAHRLVLRTLGSDRCRRALELVGDACADRKAKDPAALFWSIAERIARENGLRLGKTKGEEPCSTSTSASCVS